MSNPHQLCPACHVRFADGSCFCTKGLKLLPTKTLGVSRPDLVCPECDCKDNVIESVDKDQIDWRCLCTTARCIKCRVFWSIPIPYMRRAYKTVISKREGEV